MNLQTVLRTKRGPLMYHPIGCTIHARGCAKAQRRQTRLAQDVGAVEIVVFHHLMSVFQSWSAKLTARVIEAVQDHAQKADIGMIILDDVGLDTFTVDLVEELTPFLDQMFRQAGVIGVGQTNIPMNYKIVQHLDAAAKEYAAVRAAELVGIGGGQWSIEEATRAMLRSAVTDAVEGGWAPERLADTIRESFAFSEERAATISRTELAFAHVEGNVAGWKETGMVEGKRSILGDNHDIPDECDLNANQGVVALDEAFASGDMYPPYHPNCICDVTPVLREPS